MSAERLNVEILLKDLTLDPSLALDGETRHLLRATLLWPRPLIAQRLSLSEIKLTEGRHDFSADAWHGRVLFKETVQGNFAIGLSLSAALKHEELAELLAAFADPLMKTASAGIETVAGIGSLPAGLLAAPFAHFVREASKNDDPRQWAEGAIDENLTDLPGTKSGVVPLTAVREITASARMRRGDRIRTVKRKLAPAGKQIGSVTVEYRRV